MSLIWMDSLVSGIDGDVPPVTVIVEVNLGFAEHNAIRLFAICRL